MSFSSSTNIQFTIWEQFLQFTACKSVEIDPMGKEVVQQKKMFSNGKLDIGGAGKWYFFGFWLITYWGFQKNPNENQLGFHIRYHLFLNWKVSSES